MIRVPVELGDRSYDVVVGAGARHDLAKVIPAGARRAAVVTQDAIPVQVEPGVDAERFVIGPGEAAKTLATIEDLCRQFARFGLTRHDVVVAVGGGVVTDAAGFAAAVYHRGVTVVHVPTTLLGQVDAAIGGKTGVNLPEGKNLVGAFWQPGAVLCDTEVLETLPPREYRSGCGEMAKYHFLERGDEALEDLPLAERVARCVEIKASFVTADERETSDGDQAGGRARACLNYGHTLGHGLETACGYDLRHGEAVAIGLVFAARLSARLGRIDAERVRRHDRVVDGYGLPRTLPAGAEIGALMDLMRRDKKSRGALSFVLDGPRGVEPVHDVAAADVVAALEEIAG
ncbi:MAG TPA: 3-dehydroquinate synthase family protein [Acidimicrobiales bacterium]|nr:3-dehydroquinate synthase family protein [Acidimicrobiales bacterium]